MQDLEEAIREQRLRRGRRVLYRSKVLGWYYDVQSKIDQIIDYIERHPEIDIPIAGIEIQRSFINMLIAEHLDNYGKDTNQR